MILIVIQFLFSSDPREKKNNVWTGRQVLNIARCVDTNIKNFILRSLSLDMLLKIIILRWERERKNERGKMTRKHTKKSSTAAAVEIPIYTRATHERIFFLAIRMLLILPLSLALALLVEEACIKMCVWMRRARVWESLRIWFSYPYFLWINMHTCRRKQQRNCLIVKWCHTCVCLLTGKRKVVQENWVLRQCQTWTSRFFFVMMITMIRRGVALAWIYLGDLCQFFFHAYAFSCKDSFRGRDLSFCFMHKHFMHL